MLGAVSLGVMWLVKALFPRGQRKLPGRLAAVVFSSHVAAAIVLFSASYLTGYGGFYFYDDIAYATTASRVAEHFRGTGDPAFGPPAWGGYAYLLNTYGLLAAAVFTILGPEVLSMGILNSGFMTAAVLFLYSFSERVFGPSKALPAAALAGCFPSVLLWSVLNLKEALTLGLVMATFWAISRFQDRPSMPALVLALALLVPMDSLRHWLYYLLAVSLIGGVVVTPRLRPAARLGFGTLATIATFALVMIQSGSVLSANLGPNLLVSFGQVRQAMADPARSAYGGATPVPVQVESGVTLVIATPAAVAPAVPRSGSPAPTAAPPSPTTIVVAPDTRLVLAPTLPADTSEPSRTPAPNSVFVRPGDEVIVLAPGNTPRPDAAPLTVVVPPGEAAVTVSTRETISRNVLAHAPEGLLYALFAPFPWVIPSPAYAAAAVDMLVWYFVLAAAVASVWRERARWPALTPMLLMILGALAIFALVEGNLGTLLRHRAMIILPTIALGSGMLEQWLRALWGRLPLRVQRSAEAAAARLS